MKHLVKHEENKSSMHWDAQRFDAGCSETSILARAQQLAPAFAPLIRGFPVGMLGKQGGKRVPEGRTTEQPGLCIPQPGFGRGSSLLPSLALLLMANLNSTDSSRLLFLITQLGSSAP